jgi:hypothetical protein
MDGIFFKSEMYVYMTCNSYLTLLQLFGEQKLSGGISKFERMKGHIFIHVSF